MVAWLGNCPDGLTRHDHVHIWDPTPEQRRAARRWLLGLRGSGAADLRGVERPRRPGEADEPDHIPK
eukprot:9222986-Pyramimonas_sp.AAC.1